jgi:hypothetical protein
VHDRDAAMLLQMFGNGSSQPGNMKRQSFSSKGVDQSLGQPSQRRSHTMHGAYVGIFRVRHATDAEHFGLETSRSRRSTMGANETRQPSRLDQGILARH